MVEIAMHLHAFVAGDWWPMLPEDNTLRLVASLIQRPEIGLNGLERPR